MHIAPDRPRPAPPCFLQQIAEVRLYRTNAGLGGELAAHGFQRAAVGDAEQADGRADQRKILGTDARQPVTSRQFVGLRVGQRAVDLGDDFARDRARIERCLHGVGARGAVVAPARRTAATTSAAGCENGLIQAFAIAVAIGGAAGRIEVRRIARIGKLRYRRDARRQPRNRISGPSLPEGRHWNSLGLRP